MEKLKLYEKHFKEASKSILRYLDISDSEYDTSKGKCDSSMNKVDSNATESKSRDASKEKANGPEKEEKSKCQLVLSSRDKPLEELSSIPIKVTENPQKVSKFTPKVKARSPSKLQKQKSESNETEITDYLKEGEILYPKLIKDEINKFDKELLVKAKKANSIGGE